MENTSQRQEQETEFVTAQFRGFIKLILGKLICGTALHALAGAAIIFRGYVSEHVNYYFSAFWVGSMMFVTTILYVVIIYYVDNINGPDEMKKKKIISYLAIALMLGECITFIGCLTGLVILAKFGSSYDGRVSRDQDGLNNTRFAAQNKIIADSLIFVLIISLMFTVVGTNITYHTRKHYCDNNLNNRTERATAVINSGINSISNSFDIHLFQTRQSSELGSSHFNLEETQTDQGFQRNDVHQPDFQIHQWGEMQSLQNDITCTTSSSERPVTPPPSYGEVLTCIINADSR